MEEKYESRIGRGSARLVKNDSPAKSLVLPAIVLFLLCNVVFLQIKLHELQQKVENELPPLSKKTTPKFMNLKKQLGNVEELANELRLNFTTIDDEINGLQDKVHEIFATAEKMALKVDKLSNKSQNLENELERTKISYAALCEDVAALREETSKNITDLSRKAEDNNTKLSNEMQIHRNSLKSLAAAEKAVENRLNSHQTIFYEYKSDTESKLTALNLIKNIVFALRTSLDTVEEDSKRTAKILSITALDFQKGVKALNDKQNDLTTQVEQQRVQLKAATENLGRLIKSATDELAKTTTDCNKLMSYALALMRDGNETLKQVKDSEVTLRVEIEKAKAVVKGEALQNMSSYIQNTEAYVQTVVALMNADTTCGGKFIALPSSQKFLIGNYFSPSICTFTVLALSGKRIEYNLPAFYETNKATITIDDGEKWNYNGRDTQARTTRGKTLVITFNADRFYMTQYTLYVTYKAV